MTESSNKGGQAPKVVTVVPSVPVREGAQAPVVTAPTAPTGSQPVSGVKPAK